MADLTNPITAAKDKEHWLLTSPGVQRRKTNYSLGEKQFTADLATVALLNLLPEERRPSHVAVLVTKDALEKTFAYLREELEKVGYEVTAIEVPDGKTPDEIWKLLSYILEGVPRGIRLTIDVTHGFRSLPFIYLTAALFLTALRDVTIDGVYYGMLEAKDDSKPLVDLSLVLELGEWFYATRIFRETGLAAPLVRLFDHEKDKMKSMNGPGRDGYIESTARLVESIKRFSWDYAAGLPLEAGLEATKISESEKNSNVSMLHVPAGSELVKTMIDAVKPFALGEKADDSLKESTRIGLAELKREASFIDLYLQREQYGIAIQLIREWMVNRALLSESYGSKAPPTDWWLNTKLFREKTERKLNVLRYIPSDLLTPSQRKIRGWWQVLTQYRNEIAHCGFRPKEVDIGNRLEKVKETWSEVKSKADDEEFWRSPFLTPCFEGVLLVSPLGKTRGALFTALRKVKPKMLLPIVSQETLGTLNDIASAAGFTDEILSPLIMKDPFQGFDEIRDFVEEKENKGARKISKELAITLLRSSKVVVNLTGGTTVMQQLAQQVAECSRELEIETSIVAMIDRRTRREQEENPYVEGDMIVLRGDLP